MCSQTFDHGECRLVERTDMCRIVGAPACQADMRALDMNAPDPIPAEPREDRIGSLLHHLVGIGDHGGQDCCRAKCGMGRGDGAKTLGSGGGIEQDTTATVNLDIEETGGNKALYRIRLGLAGKLVESRDPGDMASLDPNRGILAKDAAVEDRIGVHPGHCTSPPA